MKKIVLLAGILVMLATTSVKAQVTIGKEKPAEKFSALEIVSNGENGLRLPRMTTAERDKLPLSGKTPAEGLLIFNTDTKCMDFWNGTKWTSMCTDVSGRYRLSGKICFDVNQTEGTIENCKPKSSRPNDFALTKSFIYTFSSPTGSAYSELSFITDDPTIATVTFSGNTATVTFANDIVSLAIGKDKTQALKLSITAQFRDNNAVAQQVSLVVSIQDCSCGCMVKSTLGNGWLTFMCHNLGADETMSIAGQMAYASPTGSNVTNSVVYGDLYQWGRKADGHEKRTSPHYLTDDNSQESSALADAALDGNGQVPIDHDAYGKFIKQNSGNLDWRITPNNDLWYKNNAKTVNDPCPAGWRVPTRLEWSSIFDEDARLTGNSVGTYPNWNTTAIKSGNQVRWNESSNTHGLEISAGDNNTALFLPATGNRSAFNGSLLNTGTHVYYCSSTTYSTATYTLYYYRNGYLSPLTTIRAGGASVRCVSE